MPARIGELDLPRSSPHFLALRVAVRPFIQPHVHIGLSGGPDSLALLAATLAEGAEVTAICIDHDLQPGSAAVSENAAAQARAMGAGAIIRRVEVAGKSMEAAAREARYRAFAELTDSIWVAHTMDDQAETLLLRGLRGNPGGMLVRTRLDSVDVIRPLLGIRRADTHGACAELGLRPWSDPHNTDRGFRRIAIRERVLPLLGEISGGDAVPALALAASRAAEDSGVLEAGVEKRCGEWLDGFPVALAAEPTAVRHRMLAHFLRTGGVAVTSRIIDAVDRLLTHWHGQGGVAVGGDATGRLEVVRRDGKLMFSD
ncbi:tRNA lysidine(34) synthetase TilS [Corynebacterium pacaense]|uniref:tRNA lysidine(34) synthetase TilS n=1 Tax=Corynebacterium pacaense TaxID=1816684 RepID=UPI0009BA2449|nr:tRNA lysidine(34) synthetase TilS [Corynebacterium pacaense]